MNLDSIELKPAYGRDYTSKKEVQADFDAGKDFQIVSVHGGAYGQYANNQDLVKCKTVLIRYKNLEKVHAIYR